MNQSINFNIQISYNPQSRFKISISNSVNKAVTTLFAPDIDPETDHLLYLIKDYFQEYYPSFIGELIENYDEEQESGQD